MIRSTKKHGKGSGHIYSLDGFISEEITNLPTSINELILIYLETDNVLVGENKKYIIKIPFDCRLSTIKLKEYTKHYINYVHEQMCPVY